MQNDFFDPIYKGCTAPSTILGVPLIPFILGALVIGQLSFWGFFLLNTSVAVFFMVIGVFLYAFARKVGANDEHRVLQYLMKARMRGRQSATRKFWGAVSFSPLSPRK